MTDDPVLLSAAAILAVAALAALAAIAIAALRNMRRHDAEAAEKRMAELARLQVETSARLSEMRDMLAGRQAELHRAVNERLDSVTHHLSQSMTATRQHTADNLAKLNERLAVIDAAQKNLTDLTGEVVGLKDVLSNKQTRGAYGQGRMEAIVRDALPGGAYEFQPTLSNRTRPDCMIRLPGDPRCLVVDAKFPLEGFTQFREAKGEDARARAAQRVRGDVTTHIKDIAEKYFIAGETQDIALMFVPAESLYADLQEHFDDVVQRAHRARVVIVSPSLLALAIQVLQALVRDARIREEARVIQIEVTKLLEDVNRLRTRVDKLDTHFRQAQDDVDQIRTSTDKISARSQKIEALEFEDDEAGARAELLRAQGPTLRAVE